MHTGSSLGMISSHVVALGLALPFISCDASPSADSRVSVVDSAGVEIVESRRPLWGDGDEWRISDAPVLQIGTVTGDPAYELHRVAGVIRLSDGRIVVANDGSRQLRFYDAKGVHLRDVGRQGEGPGEFQFLYRVWTLPADSLATFDNAQMRVSIFDSQGTLVRSRQLQVVEGMGRPSAQTGFSDGSILTISGVGSLSPQEGRIEGNNWIYSRYSGDGSFLNRIGEGRGGPRWGTDYRGRFTFPYLPLVLGIPPGGAGPNSLYLGEGSRLEGGGPMALWRESSVGAQSAGPFHRRSSVATKAISPPGRTTLTGGARRNAGWRRSHSQSRCPPTNRSRSTCSAIFGSSSIAPRGRTSRTGGSSIRRAAGSASSLSLKTSESIKSERTTFSAYEGMKTVSSMSPCSS